MGEPAETRNSDANSLALKMRHHLGAIGTHDKNYNSDIRQPDRAYHIP